MLEYPIKFWEPVLSGCSSNPVPSIYIEPDVDLLTYFKQNNNLLECTITGTGNDVYENKSFIGVADRSTNIPNARPNYYATTGMWIITLTNYSSDGSAQTWWNGYPSTAGKVVFRTGPFQSYSTTPGPSVGALKATSPQVDQETLQQIKTAMPEILTDNTKRLVLDNMTILLLLAGFLVFVIFMAMRSDK